MVDIRHYNLHNYKRQQTWSHELTETDRDAENEIQ